MVIAVLLVAGSGSRMKNILPKQFIEINNKPLFLYTLEKFLINEIDKIVLVINNEYKSLYNDYLNKFNIHNIDLVSGGLTRQESVYNALSYLDNNSNNDDIILLHDGARPLVTTEIILNNINLIKENKNPVVTINNIVDTIVDKEYNLNDRNNLLMVQTPQTFIYQDIKLIHKLAKENNITSSSDDAQLAKKFGYKIDFVKGSRFNIKITEPEDIKLFNLLKEGDK